MNTGFIIAYLIFIGIFTIVIVDSLLSCYLFDYFTGQWPLFGIFYQHKLIVEKDCSLFKIYQKFNWKLNLYILTNDDLTYTIYAKKLFIKFYVKNWINTNDITIAQNNIVTINENYITYLNNLKNYHTRYITACLYAEKVNSMLEKIK